MLVKEIDSRKITKLIDDDSDRVLLPQRYLVMTAPLWYIVDTMYLQLMRRFTKRMKRHETR